MRTQAHAHTHTQFFRFFFEKVRFDLKKHAVLPSMQKKEIIRAQKLRQYKNNFSKLSFIKSDHIYGL